MDRKHSAIIDIVEASYDLDVDGDRWLPQMLEAGLPVIDQGLGVMGVTGTRPPEGSPVIQHHHLHVASGPQDLPMRHLKAMSEAPPEKVYDLTRPGMATTLSELTTEDPWMLDTWVRSVDYARDALTLTAIDPDGRGIVILAPLAEVRQLSPPERRRWRMVGAHLSAGHRLRRATEHLATEVDPPTSGLPYDAEAVLDPNGFKITDAKEHAQASDAAEILREAAVRVDRARGSLRKRDPGEALETWKGLVHGRWSIVDWFDSDGRRFVLATRNPPGVSNPRGLNEREHQVATYAALGESSKLICYRLGLSASRTSTALRSAMHKLGAKSQAQLVEKMRGLRTLQPDAEDA
jgi:DNA-binding CsgD family transcriptional regulator